MPGENPDLCLFESIEIGGKKYLNSDFEYLATINFNKPSDVYGTKRQMLVYKMGTTGRCLHLPHPGAINHWMEYYNKLKDSLERLRSLGFMIQEYEFVIANLYTAGKCQPMSILVADDFKVSCEKNSLVIHDPNAQEQNKRAYGKYEFLNILKDSENPEFVRLMFSQIIQEYAIALMFNFPATATGVDYYIYSPIAFERTLPSFFLEKQKVLQAASPQFPYELTDYESFVPKARYMFWDLSGQVMRAYISSFPFVPHEISVDNFITKCQSEGINEGLTGLVTSVASCISQFARTENGRLFSAQIFGGNAQRTLQNNFLRAIQNQEFLKKCFNSALNVVQEFTAQSNKGLAPSVASDNTSHDASVNIVPKSKSPALDPVMIHMPPEEQKTAVVTVSPSTHEQLLLDIERLQKISKADESELFSHIQASLFSKNYEQANAFAKDAKHQALIALFDGCHLFKTDPTAKQTEAVFQAQPPAASLTIVSNSKDVLFAVGSQIIKETKEKGAKVQCVLS
jgi:hypothetical protein